ncbi:hypothetical protein Pint_25847 [Pistacia integerrima]|uniref:Uncharacterized protein n=1 Tax=Pistacia integerrima TaxID=434235 RepID=A0ACC0YHJ4_9ROSI|nr:hypothetical protein Pint_25847 [Pistacia integerrima]
MAISQSVKEFFLSLIRFIISQMSQIRQRMYPPPSSQPPSSSSTDIESQAAVVPQQNHNPLLHQWGNILMAFCFTSALEIAILSAQIQSQLPVSFHILSFAILLIFLFLLVSSFIGHHFKTINQVLELVSVILFATTFVFTIAIPFRLSLKCLAWTLCNSPVPVY